MTVVFQGSLFSGGAGGGRFGGLARARRTELADGAWVEVLRCWLPRPDEVFEHLAEHAPWREERREMYERVVGVPRLLAHYSEGAVLPHPLLGRAREALSAHYGPELGEPFRTTGLCYYRDGRDSVAWHGDRFGRGAERDTMVAIVSVGEPRVLALRPRGGGAAVVRLALGHGDLVVMGGSCQRTWDHAVPKTARAVGPRISVQFRPRGVA
ncbi:alpha-ketoglutarate-dependent dioxygenase AlkB [Streptacidiphilus cavernicola]|uniref:Alpha-ketoglutarate-dependent dioxygenase AlkB n=1 Tax=Streptacidiphilus cavernicola TaxID=3342716 RepID=A0ABV6VXF0_9ACTN